METSEKKETTNENIRNEESLFFQYRILLQLKTSVMA
jgi:hypothetical protein